MVQRASQQHRKRKTVLGVLVALAALDNANAVKSENGAEEWKPPRTTYHCAYSKKWINIKHYWILSVTREEKSALKQMLSTCR